MQKIALVAEETKEIGGIVYNIKKWSDDTHFYKKIIIDGQYIHPYEYIEKMSNLRSATSGICTTLTN